MVQRREDTATSKQKVARAAAASTESSESESDTSVSSSSAGSITSVDSDCVRLARRCCTARSTRSTVCGWSTTAESPSDSDRRVSAADVWIFSSASGVATITADPCGTRQSSRWSGVARTTSVLKRALRSPVTSDRRSARSSQLERKPSSQGRWTETEEKKRLSRAPVE